MSIMMLSCECSSTVPLLRQTAQRAGIVNWMEVELHKGKEQCLQVLSWFPITHKQLLAFRALEDFISNNGTFAVFVGWDKEYFYWSDIAKNEPASVARAEAIIHQFA